MAGAVRRLVADGRKVLLQIHDFSEDGRPANYALIRDHLENPEDLYPIAEHLHYAVLNGRDLDVLLKAGIPSEKCHLLANPVTAPSIENEAVETEIFPDKRCFVYQSARFAERTSQNSHY